MERPVLPGFWRTRPLRLGTRSSALALAQVELTRAALENVFPGLRIVVEKFTTRGDQKLDLSLIRGSEAGGKGLFTKELEDALFAGVIDVAVHSLKDLPGDLPKGLHIAAVLPRANTADMLIARDAGSLEELPHGARIGTSSIRRARQLQWLRADLRIEEWRGNVQTRLRKLGENQEVAGIVLAQAGLDRLGFDTAGEHLESQGYRFRISSLAPHLLPAIGQGAIALEAATGRREVHDLLAHIDHPPTTCAIRAERELQRLLSGDCTLPVGVRTLLQGDRLQMQAILFSDEATPPRIAVADGPATTPETIAADLWQRLQSGK